MDKQLLQERIDAIKFRRPLTNCYSMGLIDRAERFWLLDEGVAFAYADHGVERLVYFALDTRQLDALLDRVDGEDTYYLEFMTQKPEEYVPPARRVARMQRLVNPDCRGVFEGSPILRYRDDTVGEAASEADTQEINRLLWSVFSTGLSHLLSDDELLEAIRAGQVTVHRGDGIDALIQANVMPKKFYINQIINQADRRIIHAMLLRRLWDYVENGGKYLYAWVDEANVASQKFHMKYGMRHDGMWNMVYCLDRG